MIAVVGGVLVLVVTSLPVDMRRLEAGFFFEVTGDAEVSPVPDIRRLLREAPGEGEGDRARSQPARLLAPIDGRGGAAPVIPALMEGDFFFPEADEPLNVDLARPLGVWGAGEEADLFAIGDAEGCFGGKVIAFLIGDGGPGELPIVDCFLEVFGTRRLVDSGFFFGIYFLGAVFFEALPTGDFLCDGCDVPASSSCSAVPFLGAFFFLLLPS